MIGDTIFNLESGNLSKIPLNKYDEQFDLLTEKPKKQLLEKLSSGRYLGEVVRTVLLDLVDNNVFNSTTEAKLILKEPYIINTEFISTILNSGCSNTNKIFAKINISFKDQYQKEKFLLISNLKQPIGNLIEIEKIVNIDLYNNHYSIAYRDERNQIRQVRKLATPFIRQQIEQSGLKLNIIS